MVKVWGFGSSQISAGLHLPSLVLFNLLSALSLWYFRQLWLEYARTVLLDCLAGNLRLLLDFVAQICFVCPPICHQYPYCVLIFWIQIPPFLTSDPLTRSFEISG
jgi:hypothetical protein